jgi:2-oxoglutarate dehydrogenase E2 component (dihydrolipoamide succinyltransferase)
MQVEVKIPSVGESVTEAVLAQWFKKDGDTVRKDEPLFVIETDKVTLEVVAGADGVLKILAAENETVAVGAVVGVIDSAAQPAAPPPEAAAAATKPEPEAEPTPATAAAPPVEPAPPAAEPAPAKPGFSAPEEQLAPSVRRLAAEKGVDLAAITGSGPAGRITKGDVLLHLELAPVAEPAAPAEAEPEVRKAMSPIRRRIAARLLEAKQNTAMLTTFNEIDMARTMALRSRHKEAFKKRHGVSLGFMSFFTRACVLALGEIPDINAYIDGEEIVYHNYCHVGIAVGTERGLVVPVIRNAERLSLAGIEQAIVDYVHKIKENRLELADLEGGTFTISNGGVFGSLLSTPILNPPQSGILGMHKIEKRPVVVDDQIVVRPMMYVALSYDHRIVDGKGAVTFLKRVKELVEEPERMMMEI